MDRLSEAEKLYLDRFTKQKNRTDEEVKAFIRIIRDLREQPDKNPLLKERL